MARKLIGQVTVEEKNEIQAIFERKNGLNELAQIISVDNKELYEKLVKDLGETSTKFQSWWDKMSQKYNWEIYFLVYLFLTSEAGLEELMNKYSKRDAIN